MSTLLLPDEQALNALSVQIAAGGDLEKVTVRLYVNDVSPARNSVLADFTEASFPGYLGSHSITWGPPFMNAAGVPEVVGDTHQFQPTDSTTPEIAYGWFGIGVGADSIHLKGAERFDTPIALNTPSDIVIVLPRVTQQITGSAFVEGP